MRDLLEGWTEATEGPGTWSPYAVMGHLIHGEVADWMPRLEMILKFRPSQTFAPFDREAQFQDSRKKRLGDLLDEFGALRREGLGRLAALDLQPEQLALTGTHPAFGAVTVRQLLATWTAHDSSHLVHINRVMAKRYREDVDGVP